MADTRIGCNARRQMATQSQPPREVWENAVDFVTLYQSTGRIVSVYSTNTYMSDFHPTEILLEAFFNRLLCNRSNGPPQPQIVAIKKRLLKNQIKMIRGHSGTSSPTTGPIRYIR